MNKLLSIIAILLSLVAIGGLIYSSQDKVVVPSAEEIASKINISVPSVDNSTLVEVLALKEKVNSMSEFEDEADEILQNDTAKALVLSEIQTRDFKKEVKALLNDNPIMNMSVEDYKDLDIYFTKIESVDLGSDPAEVEVTIKVSAFNDGDEDDSEKARVKVVFIVEDLDVDEIEESEVSEYDLSLEKFYD